MNKVELYRNGDISSREISETLHDKYAVEISDEIKRLLGNDLEPLVKLSLLSMPSRLSEIPMECDISVLAFDCLRKEILSYVKKEFSSFCTNNQALMDYVNYTPQEHDSTLLEIILPLFSAEQIKYFLDRYYYFRDVQFNKEHERNIADLFRGKGIASFRIKSFDIAVPQDICSGLYVDLLDGLDLMIICRLLSHPSKSGTFETRALPLKCILMENRYKHLKCLWKLFLFLFLLMMTLFGIHVLLSKT